MKVLDFGIAQTTNLARQVETGGGRVKGKLAYLSPEQVRLEPLDARSDVFALGVVLWEMLTGRRLFAAENEFLTMRGVLTHPIAAPSSIRPDVPAAVDTIVARALERERTRRYDNAQDMADDLERFLQEAPCHSQAQGRLLHDLFGEESVELTPDFPTLGVAASSAAPAPLPSPLAEVVVEMDADVPPPSAAANLAAGLAAPSTRTPTPIATVSPPPPPSPSLASRRTLVRRTIAAAAGATLIACFSWAAWHGRHAAPVAVHLPAPAPAPPFFAAPSPPAPGATPLAVASSAPRDPDPAPK